MAYATIQQRHQIFSCQSIVNKAMNCLLNAKCCIEVALSVQTLFWVLSWGTFGSGCSFWSLVPRALFTKIWRNSDILVCRSSQAGWVQPWLMSQQSCLSGFRVLVEPLKDIDRAVLKPILCTNCVLRAIVLLDCKTLGTLLRSWALYVRFSLNKFLCLAPVLLSQLQKNTPTAQPVWPLSQ